MSLTALKQVSNQVNGTDKKGSYSPVVTSSVVAVRAALFTAIVIVTHLVVLTTAVPFSITPD